MKHTKEKWFDKTNLIDYWNKEFKYNTMGEFKAPYSTNRNFNSDNTIILERLVEIAIMQITQMSNVKGIFNSIQWLWLMEDTQFYLRQAVMEQVQFIVNNRLIWEKVNSSNIQTPNGFQITNEAQTYLLKADALGLKTKELIDASGIKDYESQTGDEFIYQDNQGQVYVVGKVDLDKIKELAYD